LKAYVCFLAARYARLCETMVGEDTTDGPMTNRSVSVKVGPGCRI